MTRKVIEKKLNRIRSGEKPRVLDLFAGCGGLSLGFHAVGYETLGAVEIDPIAARSYARNFFRDAPAPLREIHGQARDITQTEPEQLLKDLDLKGAAASLVDVIIGGPPCQAFARVGRAKLREIAEHPDAFLIDPRSNLYTRYMEYVKRLKPVALLMENVPDILNFGGHNIAEEMCEALDRLGYNCGYTLLNSVYFGIPQMRERAILMAVAKEASGTITFPRPTHWIELPRGYYGSRQVALQTVRNDLFSNDLYYIDLPAPDQNTVQPAISAKDALEDLPSITLHLEGRLTRGARRFDKLLSYRNGMRLNDYARLMRAWPGFENEEGVSDHVIRYLPRDYDIFRRMEPGDQYPEAYGHAVALFEERRRTEAKRLGREIRKGTSLYRQLFDEIVPPYDSGKFPNKWRKMEADRPARTLMAHLGKDGYSHIHYDSNQARTISVREAARLQSFPDGFVFEGTMNPAFRQIGNAVPPLMARAVAEEMMHHLRGETDGRETGRKEAIGV